MTKVLHVTASARHEGSISRELSANLVESLSGPYGQVVQRDLAKDPVPFVDADWVGANFTSPEARTELQNQKLSGSEALVRELEAADQIVIGVPIYNFGIPAALKAWVDQIARAKRTFRYTANGPEGLIQGKTAWLVIASGGTEIDSNIDFATPYMRHVLGFVGITDVRVIDAAKWGSKSDDEKALVLSGIKNAAAEAA